MAFILRATGRDRQAIDAAEVRRALAVLADPGAGVQIQGLPSGRWQIVGGGDVEAAIRAANEFSDDKGVYFSLNPCDPARTEPIKATEMLRRRWLLFDLDVKRPADTNSTNAEHDAARDKGAAVMDYLTEQGWPEPVCVDSGNGWHLLYRIDLAADRSSQMLVRGVIYAIADRFDGNDITVDRAVHNANRVSKLPGTMARKGPHSDDRPHRWAKLIYDPEPAVVVTAELLKAVAGEIRSTENGVAPPSPDARTPILPFILTAHDGGSEQSRLTAYARNALKYETLRVRLATEGTRNTVANDAGFRCGTMVGANWLVRQEVEGSLLFAAHQCGLPEGEAKSTISRAITAGMAHPRQIPTDRPGYGPAVNGHAAPVTLTATATKPEDWQEPASLTTPPGAVRFPVEVFPAMIQRFISEASWAINVPPDFIASSVLAVASGAIGNSRRLMVKRSYYQSAALYMGFVARPGAAKSAALKVVTNPLHDAEKEFRDDHKRQVKAWKLDTKELPPPRLRRAITLGGTVEGLARMLCDNERGTCLIHDELAALVSGLNQYKSGGKGNDRQFYLSAWDQTTYSAERADGSRSLFLAFPYLAILGAIQPDRLVELRGERNKDGAIPDDGFMDRFLISYPESLPEQPEQWRDIAEETERDWAKTVKYLLDMKTQSDGKAYLLRLSSNGRAAYQEFTTRHAAETNASEFPDYLRGPWAKLRGYCVRLSLVLHLLDCACDGLLDEEVDSMAVNRAATLIRYFKANTCRALAVMGSDPVADDARYILRWIINSKPAVFRERNLFSSIKTSVRFPKMEALRRPLELLCRHGFIREMDQPRTWVGRRPSSDYEVNPMSFDMVHEAQPESSLEPSDEERF